MSGGAPSAEFRRFLERRQRLGFAKYGHGVRREEDTRRFGTHEDSWWEMAQEEIGDAVSYVVCARLRAAGADRDPAADDDNAAVLRAVAEGRDPHVVQLTRLWHSYERAKGGGDEPPPGAEGARARGGAGRRAGRRGLWAGLAAFCMWAWRRRTGPDGRALDGRTSGRTAPWTDRRATSEVSAKHPML